MTITTIEKRIEGWEAHLQKLQREETRANEEMQVLRNRIDDLVRRQQQARAKIHALKLTAVPDPEEVSK